MYQVVLISTVASEELGSKQSNKDDIEWIKTDDIKRDKDVLSFIDVFNFSDLLPYLYAARIGSNLFAYSNDPLRQQ